MELKGRTAVVTGASTGIGLAITQAFAAEGMRIVMASSNSERLADAAAQLAPTGADVLPVLTDVSQRDAVLALAAAARERFGPIDVLCNNAGFGLLGYAWQTPQPIWKQIFDVNLWGVVHALDAFLPDMIARDSGYVVNTASMAGLLAGPGMTAYVAAKYALVGLTEALHQDLLQTGSNVRCGLLCPGFVATRAGETASRALAEADLPAAERAAFQANLAKIAADRVATGAGADRMQPEEVAAIVVRGLKEDRFWMPTNPDRDGDAIARRAREIVTGSTPGPYQFK